MWADFDVLDSGLYSAQARHWEEAVVEGDSGPSIAMAAAEAAAGLLGISAWCEADIESHPEMVLRRAMLPAASSVRLEKADQIRQHLQQGTRALALLLPRVLELAVSSSLRFPVLLRSAPPNLGSPCAMPRAGRQHLLR